MTLLLQATLRFLGETSIEIKHIDKHKKKTKELHKDRIWTNAGFRSSPRISSLGWQISVLRNICYTFIVKYAWKVLSLLLINCQSLKFIFCKHCKYYKIKADWVIHSTVLCLSFLKSKSKSSKQLKKKNHQSNRKHHFKLVMKKSWPAGPISQARRWKLVS